MLAFVEDKTCRQRLIADYFGFEENDCKLCDSCVNKYNNWDDATIQFKIENCLSIKSMPVVELFSNFEIGMRDRILEVLALMEAEREIVFDANLIRLAK